MVCGFPKVSYNFRIMLYQEQCSELKNCIEISRRCWLPLSLICINKWTPYAKIFNFSDSLRTHTYVYYKLYIQAETFWWERQLLISNNCTWIATNTTFKYKAYILETNQCRSLTKWKDSKRTGDPRELRKFLQDSRWIILAIHFTL